MRCPWYIFHRVFLSLGKDTGPHDSLLPGGPMSCQSDPELRLNFSGISPGAD
ncbi:unnamed protein product [Staurois parvus]|uniref:Uncharacterized protein n=1 Tax=Staurois parvus TaxID=386267 RepID=A0ABN9AAV0_9NEOB|nr:unnamed protein product [Staurois parvus]